MNRITYTLVAMLSIALPCFAQTTRPAYRANVDRLLDTTDARLAAMEGDANAKGALIDKLTADKLKLAQDLDAKGKELADRDARLKAGADALAALQAKLDALAPKPVYTYTVTPADDYPGIAAKLAKGQSMLFRNGRYTRPVQFDNKTGVTAIGESRNGVIFDGEDKVGYATTKKRFFGVSNCKDSEFGVFTIKNVLSDDQPWQAASHFGGANLNVHDILGTKNHGYCVGYDLTGSVMTNVVAEDTYHSGLGGKLRLSHQVDCGNVKTNQGSAYWFNSPRPFPKRDGLAFVGIGHEMNKDTQGDGVTYVRWRSVGNNGPGKWLDVNNRNVTFIDPVCTGNTYAWAGDADAHKSGIGIFCEINPGPFKVQGGTFENNGWAGILFAESWAGEITGATFRGNRFPIVLRFGNNRGELKEFGIPLMQIKDVLIANNKGVTPETVYRDGGQKSSQTDAQRNIVIKDNVGLAN